VLTVGAAAGDELNVIAFKSFTVSDTVAASTGGTFSGNVAVNGTLDVNGNELILDADGDTSITADTDDQIDIRQGGEDRVVIGSLGIDMNGRSSDNRAYLQFRENDGTLFSQILTIPNSNIMRINTTTGNEIDFSINASSKMRLETDGDLHVDGNVVAYSTTISDIRLKKDIAPIEDAVTKVQQLNGCTFTYLKDDRKSAGLIAQDVEKVFPSAVIEDETLYHGEEGETYKTVQYDQLIGLLVEAVKELKAEIEELKDASSK
jgi:hypothetical protein